MAFFLSSLGLLVADGRLQFISIIVPIFTLLFTLLNISLFGLLLELGKEDIILCVSLVDDATGLGVVQVVA